ncbi:MAG: terminase family protein, partial [Thaumarchaeota archaeon]|nr:terminase family protein [Nitrososphaerota archaeon]
GMKAASLMFDKIMRYVEGSSLLTGSIARKTRTLIRFTNDSQIVALPCGNSGNSLRGHTAHLIVFDEAAFIPENVIMEVALPMLSTTGGTAILLSTPFDRDHYFYKAFTSPLWSKYEFKTSDNPLVSKEFLEQQRAEIGEPRFRQEYLAEFVDYDTTYFPMPLLRSRVHKCVDEALCSYCETW